MLAVSRIGTSTATLRSARRAPADPRAAKPTARALVPVVAAAPCERSATPGRRPLAAFLAHLIATRDHVPQTRALRRAEPADAIAAYGTRPVADSRGRLFTSAV